MKTKNLIIEEVKKEVNKVKRQHCDGCEECVNVCPTAGVRINRDIYLTNSHG